MKIVDDFVKRLKAQQGVALSVGAHAGTVERFVNVCLATEDASGHKHGDDGKFTGGGGLTPFHGGPKMQAKKAAHTQSERARDASTKAHAAGGSPDARMSAVKATQASYRKSRRGIDPEETLFNHPEAAKHHAEAAKIHREDARQHKAIGKPATVHEEAAGHHEKAEDMHRKAHGMTGDK